MKLYLSGPMRGIPKFNFPLFDAAASDLRAAGHDVWSPADGDRQLDPLCETRPGFEEGIPGSGVLDFHDLIKVDIRVITESEGIALLPGWEHSSGAAIELGVARDCGLRVFYVVKNDHFTWILEEETPPVIVGITGYAQSGKDSAGGILLEHGYQRLAFADALRDMLYALNPLAELRRKWHGPILYTETVQKIVDAQGWEWAKANTNVRELLQRLGTEAGRVVLGDDIWVRTAMAKVKPGGRYVFTDVRFPNEAAAIVSAGGKVIRMIRDGQVPANAHPSETAMDDWAVDGYVKLSDCSDHPNGSRALYVGLKQEVPALLRELGLPT